MNIGFVFVDVCEFIFCCNKLKSGDFLRMLRFLLILVLASPIASYSELNSAATPAQIKFAIDNQYDQTGPGAKGRETAFKTYKHLDEALVSYLNDKDTKLPEKERMKALYLLYANDPKPSQLNVKFFSDERVNHRDNANSIEPTFKPSFVSNDWRLQGLRGNSVLRDHSRWQKVLLTKSNPRSLSHYTREPEVDFNPAGFVKPKYSAPHVHPQEASSPITAGVLPGHLSSDKAHSFQRPPHERSAQSFLGAAHANSAQNFQAPSISSNSQTFQGSTVTRNAQIFQGPSNPANAHSFQGPAILSSAHPSQGSTNTGSAQTIQVPTQAGSAHSFYSFLDGEGKQHTVQYSTDHRQPSRTYRLLV